MKKPILRIAAAATLLTCTAASGLAYELELVANFDNPMDVREAPGFATRLFVVEKNGRIMVVRNGVKLATPFLDIRDIVEDSGEQGLLSLAFPSDYKNSRRFYVWYANNNGNLVLAEFRRNKSNADRAVKSSRRTVLVVKHPDAENHNGGMLHFDASNRLYISVGDGGHPNLPGIENGEPARDLGKLLGKILRINPKKDGNKPYTVPKSNPFVGVPGKNEIFAFGLRNPWRFSLENESIFIGDVGEGTQEEISAVTRAAANGGNFGWPEWEGTHHYRPASAEPNPIVPMFTYPNAGPSSVIGGYRITDPDLPDLANRYIYADAFAGDIRSFDPDVDANLAEDDQSLGLPAMGFIASFGRGLTGQIYVVGDGAVFRLEPPPPP
jgi:glucose/arabinose dehydrogenase